MHLGIVIININATKKQPVFGTFHHRDSPSHRHPVTTAAGSCEDLGRSEHECEAARKQLHRQIDTERGPTKSRLNPWAHNWRQAWHRAQTWWIR